MALRSTDKKRILAPTLAVTAALLVLSGCAMTPSQPKNSQGSGQLTKQFDCADRNGNTYIDRAELVYLAECGVVHQSLGDQKTAQMSKKSAFENGRRFLEEMDANDDDKISLLEFRAHFNATN